MCITVWSYTWYCLMNKYVNRVMIDCICFLYGNIYSVYLRIHYKQNSRTCIFTYPDVYTSYKCRQLYVCLRTNVGKYPYTGCVGPLQEITGVLLLSHSPKSVVLRALPQGQPGRGHNLLLSHSGLKGYCCDPHRLLWECVCVLCANV